MDKQQNGIHFEQKLLEIYDHLYANAPVRTPRGIAIEAGKVLRVLDYLERDLDQIELIPSNIKSDRDIFERVNRDTSTEIANKIRQNFERLNARTRLYEAGTVINLSDLDIAYMCRKLYGVLISDKDRDIFGDAMEIFRSQWAKSHGGQFFTDQKVTKLAMTLLRFRPDQGDDLVDICAGTGGFLIAGLNKIREINNNSTDERIAEIAAKTLKGQEVDPEVAEVGNATVSSRVGKIAAFIKVGNSILTHDFSEKNNNIRYNSHDCVATNPPFGTKITIKDTSILRNYELSQGGGVSKSDRDLHSNRAPDILFLEQNIKLLKPGSGRIAIVLPYQILSGPQTLYVREWLLKNLSLTAVIDLPADTFQPHTGTKASLVVGTRRQEPLKNLEDLDDRKIFMSTPKWIGHDRRGNPTYVRNRDGSISDEILTDFGQLENSYIAFTRDGINPSDIHDHSFVINSSQILSESGIRIDARFHKEHGHHKHSKKNAEINKEWEYIKLGELTERIFYPGRFTRNYVESQDDSVPFLGGANITQLLVRTEKRLSINNPKLEDLVVEPGWILITRSGTIGLTTIVPKSWKGFAVSEHVIRIIGNNSVPTEYLYAFLKSDLAQKEIQKGVYGSVIDEITPEHLGNMYVPIPKAKEKMDEIIRLVKKGEEAREVAISSLNKGVEQIEHLLNS